MSSLHRRFPKYGGGIPLEEYAYITLIVVVITGLVVIFGGSAKAQPAEAAHPSPSVDVLYQNYGIMMFHVNRRACVFAVNNSGMVVVPCPWDAR